MSENPPPSRNAQPPVGRVVYPVSSSASRNQYAPPINRGGASRQPYREAPVGNNYSPNDDEDMVESPIAPEIGGIFAPVMRLQYQRQVENSATVPLPRRVIGGLKDQVEHNNRSCCCQKSNCLKLYCECFAGGTHCNAYCYCNDCHNDGSIQHLFTRNKAILACLERNPHSFRPGMHAGIKFDQGEVIEVAAPAPVAPPVARAPKKSSDTFTPCNCNKSRCLKKYCECFRRDDFCNFRCKCHECMNQPGDPAREKLAAAARKKTGRHSAAAAAQQSRKRAAAPDNFAQSTGENTAAVVKSVTVYPPLYYAVPMPLPSGVPSATLGFGRGSSLKKRKTASSGDTSGAFERAMATEEVVLARRKAKDYAKPAATDSPTRVSESTAPPSMQGKMEQHWNEETRDVLGTFQAMRQELLKRKQDAGLLGGDIVLSGEYSYYDLVGSAQLAAVELELADVLSSVREARDHAHKRIAKEAQSAIDSEQTEQGQPNERKLSENQRTTIITEAAQDTALMRELARIIRRRAFEMSERL